MKFGVFLPNGSNGYIISNAVTPYLPTYQHNLEVTVEAEKQGLDFIINDEVQGLRWDTGYGDACLESFTLMAGLAANTQSIGIIPTVTLLSQHPAYVARMIATLDDMVAADAAEYRHRVEQA